jgi:hypothetical protein
MGQKVTKTKAKGARGTVKVVKPAQKKKTK